MRLTILLVDDDVLDREAVQRTLRKAGIDAQLLEAGTADEAFALARGADLIFLDYHLPGTDGVSVLRELRREGVDVPVIALTGQGDEHTAVELMKAGAADYLSKQALTADRLERSVRHAQALAAAERERRELLTREQLARQEAQSANRVKDEFLATLSHELRTPLNAILGWTRLLAAGQLDADTTRRGLEIIERNVSLQVKLIDDLLDISRIVTGKLSLDRVPVSLSNVVTAAVESQGPTADAAGVKVACVIDGEEHPVLGDSARLQQVVANLLSNAIKFTPKGGHIDVRLHHLDGEAHLTVRDDGAGIEPDFLPHIFERFRQADASPTRRHSGLGLGLAIVKHLVELHGGRITAESGGRDQGAAFHVTLPTAPAEPRQDSDAVFNRTTLDGITVLVVDDDADSRETMRVVLQRSGATVLTAPDAPTAIALARGTAFNMVLTDIAMPGMDGYTLLKELQHLGSGQPVVAAAITACATPEDRDRALSAGFFAHLPKPCEPARLVRTVAMLGNMRISRPTTS
jgi:signal transduction histidine kinase